MNPKATLSRIIGMTTVLIFLISCEPTQSTDSPSISQIKPSPTRENHPTLTISTKTEPNPESAATDSPPGPLQIEVIRDIPYTDQLALDVYKPIDPGPWPVVVALHGGGQSKELFNIFSKRIAELGAVVFTPTWRSSEPQSEPLTREIIIAGDEDAACALRFARAKAADFHGNPARVVVVGYSGGGTAGAVMALAGDDFNGECQVSGYSALPDVFVGIDGAYDLVNCCVPDDLYRRATPEDWELIVPYTYLDRQPVQERIEFHLIVGGTPELFAMAETFNEGLEAAGFNVSMTHFPELDHGQIVSLNLPELFAIIEDALYHR